MLLILSVIFSSCNKDEELILADSGISWWMAPTIIAKTKIKDTSFYEKNDISVKTFDMQTGLASKNALLSGSADLGIVASTPIASSIYNNEKIIVLCSFVSSNNLLALITRVEGHNESLSMPNPKVAIVPATISELYLRNYLNKIDSSLDFRKINIVNVKPADIPNYLAHGDANSAVIWEPFVTSIANTDSNLRIIRDSTIYQHRIYLITRPDVLKKKKDLIIRFINSLIESANYLKYSVKESQNIILNNLPNQKESMENLWYKVDFQIKFDYENMINLIKKDADMLRKIDINLKERSSKDFDSYFDFEIPKNSKLHEQK